MTTETVNPNNIMKQADHMRKEMKNLEDDLKTQSLSCKHQGVQIEISGDGKIQNLIIDPELQKTPIQNHQKLLIELYNKAHETVEKHRQSKLLNLLSDIQ